MFRSSLKGFFTGRNKDSVNRTTFESSNCTRESNEFSSLVTNTDNAFSGNPLKALKHNRKNLFINYGSTEAVEAKGIEELLNDFSNSANNFKENMKSIDVAEKLKQNKQRPTLNERLDSSLEREPSSSKVPKDKIKLSANKLKKDFKGMPIKADHIVIKKSMLKMNSMNS